MSSEAPEQARPDPGVFAARPKLPAENPLPDQPIALDGLSVLLILIPFGRASQRKDRKEEKEKELEHAIDKTSLQPWFWSSR